MSRARRVLDTAGRLLAWLVLAALVLWGTLAVWYSHLPAWLRPPAAALFALGSAALLLLVRPRRRGRLAFLALFAAVALWWALIPPSNDRDWQPDVAILPWAEIAGDGVTLHNVRNCVYRSETDYDVRHETRAYDLGKLRTADLFLVYWGSPHIAHTMLSFGFDPDEYVCISIETRMEKGEAYSAVKGFFKQVELTYVVADERDAVRLRTNYRPSEEVYLYRLKARPELLREVFLDYLKQINSLRDRPEWYNTATSNCTSNIRGHMRPYVKDRGFDWRAVFTGHIDELAYEVGALDRGLPLAELKARSHVNERARAAGNSPAFSRRIREGLPGIGP